MAATTLGSTDCWRSVAGPRRASMLKATRAREGSFRLLGQGHPATQLWWARSRLAHTRAELERTDESARHLVRDPRDVGFGDNLLYEFELGRADRTMRVATAQIAQWWSVSRWPSGRWSMSAM